MKMKTMFKRLTGLIVTVAMLLSMVPAVFAAPPTDFVDFPTGWSKVAMEAAVNNGLLVGYDNNEVRPQANLTRAEMAAIIARSFGAKTKSDISAYTDVSQSDWYYEYIAKVVKMGAMQGVNSTQMAPEAYITREEVFTAMARVLVLSSNNTAILDKFPDKAQISSWAVNAMAALTERGYVNGDESGNSNPKAYITREEFAQFMHNAIRTYIAEPGTYKNDMTGITVVRVGGVTLEGFTNTSDIVIGDGVLEGEVLISNVKIEERLLARGGTITLKNTTVGDRVVVNNVNGITYFKNYRDEKVFKGIVENTVAKFLTRTGGGGGSSSSKDEIYTLTFMVDGSVYDTVTVTNGVVSHTPADPTKTGYTFDGWYDENGTKVTDFGAVTSNMTLTAKFNINIYKVNYNATFVSGYTPETEYTIENIVALADGSKVVAPSGKYFSYWKDANGNKVSGLSVTDSTPEILELYPHFDDIPLVPVTVRFYEGYSEDFPMGDKMINAGETVAESDFPDITPAMYKKGYEETAKIAKVYENNEYTHLIKPSFWYVDKNTNVFVPFDDTVVITEDTNVYLLSKALSFHLTLENVNQPLSVTAFYNNDTRVMDSVKDIFAKGRDLIEDALELNVIPNYDETVDKIFEKLENIGIIKVEGDNKNIQVMNIPIPISRLIKEEIANNMINQYIRDIVANEAELNKILSLIDVKEFADQLNINDIIAGMTDDEIASLIKSSEYKDDIADYILTDIKKTDSKMLDFILEYVTEDADFRESLVNQLISDLKNASATSTLKTKAIEYIKTELANTSSQMYSKFTGMVVEDIKSTNSVVLPEVVKYIKETLGADTLDGKDLRKKILTSAKLSDILNNAGMKAEIIKLALTDSFIDKALSDKEYRTVLVEAIMNEDDFLDTLLASTEFHDYIVDQLHGTNALAADVKTLLSTQSKFKEYILDVVRHDDEFFGLLKNHDELYNVVFDSMQWEDFVSNNDDLLKYVLGQSGATGTYQFVDFNVVETIIETEYNKLGIGSYSSLTPAEKLDAKAELYGDQSAKDSILAEIKEEFDKYKKDTLDKFADGKADEITDDTVNSIINNLLVDYVTKYINKEELHTDDTINDAITEAIEEILFELISDLIKGDNSELNKPEIQNELQTMLSHIDDVKHKFVTDATPDVVEKLKTIVKDYRVGHKTQLEGIISNNYNELISKISALVDPLNANSVYTQVESALIDVVKANKIDDALISDYVKAISATELEGLVDKYIVKVTADDINKYMAAFLTASQSNVDAVKAELTAFLQADEQKANVREFAIVYLKDPLNETEIRVAISDFVSSVDATFVGNNRTVITEALKGLDISAFIDEETVKNYIKGLNETEKKAFADKIFATLKNDENYSKFMYSLMKEDVFEVNKANLTLITAISTAIKGLTYESVMSKADNAALNKIIDIVGEDFIKNYFDTMKNNYCNGLDDVIAEVTDSTSATIKRYYTTSLTLRVDLINEVYRKLYDKAQPIVEEKLEAANVYYNENEYLQYLVSHDILSHLLNGDYSLANGDFTGYSLKGELDYYDYALMLLLVGDDALCWYGDKVNLSDAEFEALYDAIFGKVLIAHEKMNELLEAYEADGTLPAQIQSIVNEVKQINDLIIKYGDNAKAAISKYLNSSINIKFEDGSIADDERIIKIADLLVGREEPIVNIDTLYALFYSYDDKVQAKLQKLLDSGKLDDAIAKFESTSFGELLSGKGKLGTVGEKLDEFKQTGKIESAIDSVYDLLVILAKEGIEPFRTDKGNITVTDAYEIKVGQVVFKIKRFYE